MNSDELLLPVLDALHERGIGYLLVGSFASNLHGIPRSTKDADFVVQVGGVSEIRSLVEALGPQFRLDPQINVDTVTGAKWYVVDVVDANFRIEFFQYTDDDFSRERFARRKKFPYLGRQIFAPTAEDVVVMKLRWCKALDRAKDLGDVQAVASVQGDRLDWQYIRHWCEVFGTLDLLEKVRASVPRS